MSSSSDMEVLRIGKQLEKIANNDTPNDEMALDLLKSLQGLPMSLDILQWEVTYPNTLGPEDVRISDFLLYIEKSHVGMSVNKLRKKCGGTELSTVAKKLIKSWKKLLPATQSPSQPSTANTKTPSQEDTPTIQRRPSNPPTPPPVVYSPSTDVAKNSNITSPKLLPNGGSSPSSQESSSSQMPSLDTVLCFAPTIDGSARVSSTGSDVRDRCRDLIIKALKKGFNEISIEEDIKFHNLSATIEELIFSEFRDTGNKYKMKVRSRVANLSDLRNPSLRQNVISGAITPSQIAVMTTEEMASDTMKKLRQQFTKDAIRDAQMATSGGGTQTDLLKCGKCKKRNCTYTQAQTRSADEPMTTFVYCNECGNRWKFC